MRSSRLIVAGIVALAMAATPMAAQAQNADPNAKAEFLGSIKRVTKKSAKLRVRYNCASGQALWVSAKQTRSGKRGKRVAAEGGSKYSAAWLQSHRNPFVCNGAPQTATVSIDKVEPGSKGKLKKGTAWVQFCVTEGEGDAGKLILSAQGWVKVG